LEALRYTLDMRGSCDLLKHSLDASGSPAADAVISAKGGAGQIHLLEGGERIKFLLQSSVRNEVSFEGKLTPTGDAAFQAAGRLRFGDGENFLRLSTAGQGRLLGEPGQRVRQGAVTLQVDGGAGLFEGVTGLVTSSFRVDESGAYSDVQTAMLLLPGEQRASAGPDIQVRVRDALNERAFPVTANATLEYVADLLAMTESSEVMVIDDAGEFIGVLSEVDLLRAAIPDVEEIIKAGGGLRDAMRIFIQRGQELASQPIRSHVKMSPRTVSPEDDLLAVATVMLQSDTRRLPVVEQGRFAGSISLADICWTIFSRWNGIRRGQPLAPSSRTGAP
jgi:CBS domain-containing protein